VSADPPVVLFVCIQNAGRSQMAEALLNSKAAGLAVARSAGSRPADAVHPEVVEVMRELNVDLSDRQPQSLGPEVVDGVDVVVTMGCGDECPYIPGAVVVDWEIDDPAGRTLDEVRAIRDDIGSRIDELLGAELLLGQ
jgi:arsenate reductase (thioredoxin)